ncbi:hypothetical protein TNCT_32051 [Trichonephila clavata]|uniref:Uncharacterized protein n=1 Tax=Trichonephila clavata TaxID=2740835 RepID=A0A8X6LF34_TRICU|nr:hypothetical protein TNCT_32051 [Trichonephila clavata]
MSCKQIVYSTGLDDESLKQNVNSKLVKILDKKTHEFSSKTKMDEQKSAKVFQEKEPETILRELLISSLESLDLDITNSIRMALKDIYITKMPGMDSDHDSITSAERSPSTSPKKTGSATVRSPSTSPKKTGSATERSPSTSPKKTGSATERSPSTSPKKTGSATEPSLEKTDTLTEKTNLKDDTECCICAYFDSVEYIYGMQLELLDIRRDLKTLTKMLLEECNKLNSCDFEEIKSANSLYENIVNQNKQIADAFEKGEYLLDHRDAIGALRLSSQIMHGRYLLLENDKFLEAFKLAQIIMTQWLLARES